MLGCLELNISKIGFHNSIRKFQTKNYYEILGVEKNATLKEIKSAFYEKSKKLHPDNLPKGESPSEFLELKTAYDVLRRPADRRNYDIDISGGKKGPRIYRYPSYYQQSPQYDFSRDWSTYWSQNPETSKNSREEREKSSRLFMKSIIQYTIFGIVIVSLYNGGHLWMLKMKEKKINQLSDEDEIAKSFLRQKEFQNSIFETDQIAEIGRIFKADVDEAWKSKCNHQKNSNEIREEYRWFRAVQDPEHIRSLKLKRMEKQKEERNKWREANDSD